MPRRLRNVGFTIAVAVVAVAVVAIVMIAERQRGHRRTSSPILTAAAAPKPSATALTYTFWPPVAPTLVSKAPGEDGQSTIEICGAGRVSVDPDNPLGAFATISKMTDPASAEWLAALLNSDDNRARATGLLLEGKVGSGASAGQVMREETRASLVQLAVGAGDPAVYAMAVYACHTYANPVPDEACPQLSLSAWAQMDSANAVPWLLLAQQARVRGDDVVAANAFAQAAKAQKVDSYNYSLLTFADPERPKGTTPLEQWSFEVQVAGVESGIQPPHGTAAMKYCSDEAMQDTTVRQQCNAIAELYVSRSTTMIDFSMGNGIGKRIGWPAKRVDSLNQDRLAMLEAQMEAASEGNDLWSCNAVARGNAFWYQRLRLGELGAVRESMRQSGESAEELAKKLGERMSKYSDNLPASE